MTALRETKEAEEGASIASVSGADGYAVRLAVAGSDLPLFGPMTADTAAGFASDLQALSEKRINIFAAGFGAFGNNNGTEGSGSYGYTQPGVTAGADYQVNERLLLGTSFGFNRASSDGAGSDNGTSTYLFSTYGSFRPTPQSFVQINIGYGRVLADTTFSGAAVKQSSTAANQMNGLATAGYDFRVRAMRFTPYATLQGSETWFPSHMEMGSAGNDISKDAYQAASVDLAGGIEVAYQVATRWGLLIPSARIECHHEFINQAGTLTGTVDGQSFSAILAKNAPDYALLGAGARLLLRDGTDVSLAYERTLGQGSAYYSYVTLTFSRYF